MKYTQIVYEVKPQTFHFVGRSGPLGNYEIRYVHLLWAKTSWDLWSDDIYEGYSFGNAIRYPFGDRVFRLLED